MLLSLGYPFGQLQAKFKLFTIGHNLLRATYGPHPGSQPSEISLAFVLSSTRDLGGPCLLE